MIKTKATNRFTFQCGSTEGQSGGVGTSGVATFTFQCGSTEGGVELIFIKPNCKFTFQCGSTEGKHRVRLLVASTHLHSSVVLLKGGGGKSKICYLHSSVVLLKDSHPRPWL